MESKEYNEEENYEREQLPRLIPVQFDDDEEAFLEQESITPEAYKEEKQVSLYTLDSREFVIKLLTDLGDLAGVPFSEDSWEKIWPKELSLTLVNLKPQFYPKGDLIPLISDFVFKIVQAGRGQKALEYMVLEISEYTRQIEDHPKSGRIITPIVFETDEEMMDFWLDKILWAGLNEEEIRDSRHRLEIHRLNLYRMKVIRKELFVKQEQYQLSKHSNNERQVNSDNIDLEAENTSKMSVSDSINETASNTGNDKPKPATPKKKKEDYTFYTVFRDEAKALKLVEVLQSKEIIDSSKKWLLNKTDIILLTRELAKKSQLVKEQHLATIGRILCKEFSLSLNPLPFNESMYYKLKGSKEVVFEFNSIITNL